MADLRRKLTQESTKKKKLVQDREVGGWVLSNHGDCNFITHITVCCPQKSLGFTLELDLA